MYVSVILPLNLEMVLTYSLPVMLEDKIAIGQRVSVPLGRSKIYTAIVVDITEDVDFKEFNYKNIIDIIDTTPLIPEQQIKFWKWISNYYLCSLGKIMKEFIDSSMIVKGVNNDDNVTYQNSHNIENYRIVDINPTIDCKEIEALKRARKQHLAYCDIKEFSKSGEVTLQSLNEIGYSNSIISQLEKKRFITISEKQRIKSDTNQYKQSCTNSIDNPNLVIDNQYVEHIKDSIVDNCTTLLINHSLTPIEDIIIMGVWEMVKSGKNILIITPDLYSADKLSRKYQELSNIPITTYTNLTTPKKRREAYIRVSEGSGNLVIGNKKSLGLPFKELSAIFVLKEHSKSYKNEISPRYSARDCAVVLGGIYNCAVILDSITPSLESYNNTLIGKYKLKRVGKENQIFEKKKRSVINKFDIDRDNRKQFGVSESRYLSKYALDRIEQTINEGKQVFIFKNNIGFSRYINCNHCGYVPICPHCNISLQYIKSSNNLVCPICGYYHTAKTICERCDSEDIQYMGYGTENIEHKIAEYFPNAKCLRVDSDKIKSKKDIQNSVSRISSNEVEIVVGTQMMINGIDFGNIDLAVIVDADQILNSSDFRCEERFMQLYGELSSKCKEVIIQSKKSEQEFIRRLIRCDFNDIYTCELNNRRDFKYPPFSRFVNIAFRHRDSLSTKSIAEAFVDKLSKKISSKNISISTPMVDKIKDEYITNLVVKILPNENIKYSKNVISECVRYFKESKYFGNYKIYIDVDPY